SNRGRAPARCRARCRAINAPSMASSLQTSSPLIPSPLQRELDLEPEDPGVRISRYGAGADVILDTRPELERREDLDRVGELDQLLAGLNRFSRCVQLKLKAWVNVRSDPAEAQDVEFSARNHTPSRRARLVVMFEFGGILVPDR